MLRTRDTLPGSQVGVLACAVLLAVIAGPRAAGAASFIVDTTADAVDAAPGDANCATGAGACSLRAAVQESNALAGSDDVTVPGGTYVLTLAGADEDAASSGDLDVSDDLTITGAGAGATILDGNLTDRVLHVIGTAALSVAAMTIQNGQVMQSAVHDSWRGHAILNTGGTLSLRLCTVRWNVGSAPPGFTPAAIDSGWSFGPEVAHLDIIDSTITENSAGVVVQANTAGIGVSGTIVGSAIIANDLGLTTKLEGEIDIRNTTFSGNALAILNSDSYVQCPFPAFCTIEIPGGTVHLANTTVTDGIANNRTITSRNSIFSPMQHR